LRKKDNGLVDTSNEDEVLTALGIMSPMIGMGSYEQPAGSE
jgi:hypothetical protein